MAVFDMKTVMFANVIVNFVGMVVMSMLWYQNHDKYSGIAYWVLDWILLTGGMALISFQGNVPPWESMILSNTMIVGGTVSLYFGLRLFAGRKNSPLLIASILIALAAFIAVHTYFTYGHADLLARSDNAAIGLLLVCLLAMWLLFKEVSPQIRRISKGTGIAFGIIGLICLIRIFGFSMIKQTNNQFLLSGKFDTFWVMLLVGATVFLVFNLVLMVTRRLYIETDEMGDIVSRNAMELQAVFRTTSVGFGIMADRVFKEINEAYCRIIGYSRDELVGKEVRMVYPTDEEYRAVGQLYPKVAELGAVTTEIRLMRKDGVIIDAILNIAAFDKNDLSVGIIFSILDITARKQAEEALRQSEEKYRLIVENALDVIFTTNLQEEFAYVSPSVKNILGYTPAELIGRKFISLVHPQDVPAMLGEIKQSYTVGYQSSVENEYRLRHASGEWRWVVSRGSRVVDTKGDFLYFIGIIKDITGRKQAEDALRLTEQNLRNSIERSFIGTYILNIDLGTVYVNKAFMDIFGYKNIEEIKTGPPHTHYTPESYAKWAVRHEKLMHGTPYPENYEADIVRKDGAIRHLQVYRQDVFWDGKMRYQVLYHDITERKQAEEALKESERRYRSLFENMTNGYAYCRMIYRDGRPVDFQYINVNKAFEKQTGLTGVDGKLVSVLIPGVRESDPELFERYGRVALTGSPESFEMYVASLHMWFSVSVYSPQREYFVAIFDVITERKLAEQALRDSEARYKTLFESAAEGIMIADILTREQKYANPAICKMLGYTREELTKMKINDIHPPDLRGFATAEFDAQVRGDKTVVSLPCLRKDGTIIYMDISAVKTIIDGRECNVGFFTDITARKQAEDALKASEQKYSALVEESGDGIIILDNRSVVFANQKMIELTGYHSDELYGKIFTDLVAPEYKQMLDEGYRIRQANSEILPASYELALLTRDGRKVPVETKANRILMEDRFTVMVTIRDITGRKQAEAKIMASLAEKETLLKEVHHRVKNNMQVISSLLRLQERKVKDKDSAALLRDSQNRIQSMALVYNKLYRSENLAGIDMNEYINELALGLVKSYAVSPSEVTVQVAPGGVFLDVDLAIPCGMVVNELVTNSLKYAFPDNRKGRIFISLKEEVNHTLELVVSDNGVGMPENFNPDNTATLGIKLVSNLVRDQLGGKMELIRSRGLTVRITFRRVKEEM